MSLYRITSYKRLVSEPTVKWSNVYTFDAAGLVTATDLALALVTTEQAVHTADVQFYLTGIRSLVDSHSNTKITSTDVGLLGSDPTIMLPLWNVARVDFLDASGRPEIKYLRMPLQEDMVTGSIIDGGTVTTLQDDYAAALLAEDSYVGPSGEAHTGYVVHNAVQMRQTSWHRRARPGFHRGWVPN